MMVLRRPLQSQKQSKINERVEIEGEGRSNGQGTQRQECAMCRRQLLNSRHSMLLDR